MATRSGRRVEVTVVAPALNEARNLPDFVRRTARAAALACREFQLVVVLDGGTDDSPEVLRSLRPEAPRLEMVRLGATIGQHAALAEGLRHARGRFVVTIDADLQNPPEAIPDIVARLRDRADAVGTIRSGRQDAAVRKVASAVFRAVMAGLRLRHSMADPGCMLRGWTADVVQRFLESGEAPYYLPIQLNERAATYAELATAHAARTDSASRYGSLRLARLLARVVQGRLFPRTLRRAVPRVVETFGGEHGE